MEATDKRLEAMSLRIMAQIDHFPHSQTYGCADRAYWHYQDGKGFAVGSYQVCMLGLWGAGKASSHQGYILAAQAAFTWWEKQILIQAGSLDEYFRGQKSFCATAYSTMSAAAYCKLSGAASLKNQSFKLAIKFLVNDKKRPISANQTLAAMLALDLVGYGKNPFVLELSSQGEFYEEYGGFDLGYSLKCIDICVLACLLIEDIDLRKKYHGYLSILLSWLHLVCVEFCFHPILGARGNAHKLLGGLLFLDRNNNQLAKECLLALNDSSRFSDLVLAEQCDDKYLSFFHLTSLFIGSTFFKNNAIQISVRKIKANNFFITKGFVFYKTPEFRLAIASQRGGAFYFESKDKKYVHAGYSLRDNGHVLVSYDGFVKCEVSKIEEQGMRVSLPLAFKHKKNKTDLIQNLFFSFSLKIALALPLIGKVIRNLIYLLSSSNKSRGLFGSREFSLINNKLVVKDVWEFHKPPELINHNWIMTDGHATRMHSSAEICFETINKSQKIFYFEFGD